ncbi:MAG TPA: alkylglycerone-phosphate synthase, partial [Alphaproteobacteria bacterium]|nr:alkylglycerone-phosphate synthase [Alphaproteobacteria bacterium]
MPVDRMATRWNGWGLSSAHSPMEGRDAAWPWVADALGVKELPQTHPKPLAEIALPPSRLTGLAAAQLADVLRSDQIAPEPLERASHARGKSYHDLLHLRAGKLEACPDAVVYPENTDDALQLLQWAQDHDAAIVPFGGGSSVVGGVTAQGRDLVIAADMTRMNAVVSTDPVSRTAVAQGGIYGIDLETKLQAKGLTLGHYPQSFEFSTLGGWIAARGAGQQSNRYGKAEKWLVGAELATPSGLWRTEQFPASAAGPNFNHLVAGSEGTLGLITEARFRVHTVPNVKQYRTYLMPSFEAGADAIRTIVQDEVPVA